MQRDRAWTGMQRAIEVGARALTRRQLLLAGSVALGGLVLGRRAVSEQSGWVLPERARNALGESSLVYVSPLHRDGRESSCHGEVWYFVDEGDPVIITASDGWKVRAIKSGRDRARLWVGDFGPVQGTGGRYREAPGFLARAELDTERAVFDRLMASFGQRYAEEWGKWQPRFEKGYGDKSRVLVRYTPIGD